jgi:signal transduction histidine kinase
MFPQQRRSTPDPEALHAAQRMLFRTESGLLAACAIALTFLWRLVRQSRVVSGLRRQNQRVVELEEIKSTYLRLASHELRTPIGVARGYVDLAQSGELGVLPDRLRQAMSQMEASLRDVDAILAEMVEIARMQEGRRLLRVENLDLRDPVNEASQRVQPLTSQHRLVVSQPDGPIWIAGDQARIRAAVRNLLENAVKYSPNGGVVRCAVSERSGMASVTVSDQGMGMGASQLQRLFRRFERAPEASSSSIPGTGLGLHLAREIARAHGGDLRVSSEPGVGTTFVLLLPAARRSSQPNGDG